MPKLLPYFRWYPADAETDENFRGMEDADIGFYLRCLNHAWINGGIPADPVERARVLRTQIRTANRRWERVGKCFVSSNGNPLMLVNLRQESERTLAKLKSEMAVKSIKTRYERNTNVLLRAYESVSVSSKNQEEASMNVYPARQKINPAIEASAHRMYDIHPKKIERASVAKSLESAVIGTADLSKTLADIEACHVAWSKSTDWTKDNSRFAPKLANWIADRGYTKWPNDSNGVATFRPYIRNKPNLERIG